MFAPLLDISRVQPFKSISVCGNSWNRQNLKSLSIPMKMVSVGSAKVANTLFLQVTRHFLPFNLQIKVTFSYSFAFQTSTIPVYERMWAFMSSAEPSVFVAGNEEGVRRVRESENYAFLAGIAS